MKPVTTNSDKQRSLQYLLLTTLLCLVYIVNCLSSRKETKGSNNNTPGPSEINMDFKRDEALKDLDSSRLDEITSRNALVTPDSNEVAALQSVVEASWSLKVYKTEVIATPKFQCYIYNGISLPGMTEEEFNTFVLNQPLKAIKTLLLFCLRLTDRKLSEAKITNQSIDDKIKNELPVEYRLTELLCTKDNSYFPTTKVEEARVAQFNAEKAELLSQRMMMPDYCTNSRSIFGMDSLKAHESYPCNDGDNPSLKVLSKIYTAYYYC